jgi:hypothetical protein
LAHHTRVRANFAAWATGVVTQTEFNKLDENLFKSINGDDGGVWAPSSAIEIGGSGLEVSGPFVSSGGATISDGASFSGGPVTFAVDSPATFHAVAEFNNQAVFDASVIANGPAQYNSTALFKGLATFEGQVIVGNSPADSFDCSSQAQFYNHVSFLESAHCYAALETNADFIANGPATFNGSVDIGSNALDQLNVAAHATFNARVDFTGEAYFDGSVEIGDSSADSLNILATPTLRAPLLLAGAGRVTAKTFIGSNASGSVWPGFANVFHVPENTLTANRTYTISDVDMVNGDWILVSNEGQGFQLLVESPGGGTGFGWLANQKGYVLWYRISGSWRIVMSQREAV